jgi:hypothetical protein
MAATVTKSGSPGTITDRIALGATAGNATAITFPRWAREISVRIFASDNETQSAGFVSSTGTDGAAIDSNGIRVELGVPFMVNPSPGTLATVLYVSADSANDVAHVSVSA